MILNASSLTVLQSCPRRFLLEADWLVVRWRAKALFDACMRQAIQKITQGVAVEEAVAKARADFLQVAANPGLDLPYGADSYKIAKDYSSMLATVIRAATRWKLPKLQDAPVVHINSTTSWQALASMDEEGELHRFITLDRWLDADLSRELHGWGVFGDVAIVGAPMTIHVIEIGSIRSGRRASAWARAWKHPAMPNLKIHFARKDGQTFSAWVPYYLADHPEEDMDAWVELMHKEGVGQKLVQHIGVAVPPKDVCDETRVQVLLEAARARVLLAERSSITWRATPMARGACDGMVPCPWQNACHDNVSDPATTGLYQIKSKSMIAVA